ncbi:hypothetical protein D3C84_1114510 [compost metagenome]
MRIPINVKTGQQVQQRQLVDGPEPAQPGFQGVPAGLVQVLIKMTGEAALLSG